MKARGAGSGLGLAVRVAIVMAATHGVLVLFGSTTNPGSLATGLFTVLGFGITLPFSMTLALSLAALTLTIILGTIAAMAAIARVGAAQSGLESLLRELWSLPLTIVPRYFGLLRGIRSPAVWGGVLGAATATVDLAVRATSVG